MSSKFTEINATMAIVHDLANDIYEGLADGEHASVRSSCDRLISELNNIKQSVNKSINGSGKRK